MGFIFYEKSPRFLSPEIAKSIVKKFKTDIFKKFVGVFVNESISKMIDVQKHRGPDDQNFKTFDNKISLGMARLSIMDLKYKQLTYCKYFE